MSLVYHKARKNKNKEVNAKRQEKDADDLISLKENISDMVNPFDPTIDKRYSDQY